MVVLIGFLIFVAILLTRLTYKVNKASYDLTQAINENKRNKKEIAILKAQLYGQAATKEESQEA